MGELQPIRCEHEGIDLHGQLALPERRGLHPAVLVVHNAFGLGKQPREIAARLAAQGYIALAVDMYGEGAYSEDHAHVGELVKPLWGNADRLRARMGAWLDVIKARDDVGPQCIAAIGYCFGGQCVLEFARGGADVQAVVSFHGILTTNRPARSGEVRAFVSVHTGARDPHAPRSDVESLRDEMIAAGANWQITEYGDACHAFTEPTANTPETGRAYDPVADRMSWESMLALLELRLGRKGAAAPARV